ncbi:MAG: hypothetical protein PHH41_10220, partial [Sulfurimonas sp.]|nr:hypothetical protein [Sulfurimonas sp.]
IRPGYGYVTKKDIANAKLKEELKAMRQKEKEKKELPPKRDFKPKREDGDKPKRDFKPRTENSEKKEYRPKRDDDKRDIRPKKDEGEKRSYKPDEKKNDSWDKKKKSNTFLGHDETGKAKFSGKSGERNHRYDGTKKETFDAPKKPARTINIKERKKEEK